MAGFAEDDWLGLDDSPHYMSLDYSAQPSFGESYTIRADFETFRQSHLFISYGQSNAYDASTYDVSEDYSVSFATDPYADWSVAFSLDQRGKGSDIEVNDMLLDVNFYVSKRTSMTLGLRSGEIEIYPYQLSFAQTENFQNSGIGDIDKTGFSLGVAYDSHNWSFSIGLETYSYDEDISGDYRDAVEQEADGRELWYLIYAHAYFQDECERQGFTGTALENCIRQGFEDNETLIRDSLQKAREDFLAAHFAKDQKSVLAEHQMYIQYALLTEAATFELGGGLYESYIDGEHWSYGSFSGRIPFSNKWDVSMSLGYSEESASSWYGLGVGVSF